jgi:Bacterial regulatory helix-turn-helix protein, lysR family
LTWYGITVYGTIDVGGGWQSRGTPFNGTTPPGEEYLISKNSNRALWGLAPNAMSQSIIGVKGNEPIGAGWSFVFDLEAGFDPYSLRFSNGPGSIAQNAGVPLISQNSNTDSSRAGQFYNSVGYVGVSSPTYGILTVFRQNSLTFDGVVAYDPMGGSYAFSPIGYQGTTCGVGDTEDCRFSTSLKYGRQLGLSLNSVSRQLIALEDMLGTTLVERTTRHLSLTEAGRLYQEQAKGNPGGGRPGGTWPDGADGSGVWPALRECSVAAWSHAFVTDACCPVLEALFRHAWYVTEAQTVMLDEIVRRRRLTAPA